MTRVLGAILAGGQSRRCQIASKRDPFFASNFDPLTVPECRGSEGFGAVMGMALLGSLNAGKA